MRNLIRLAFLLVAAAAALLLARAIRLRDRDDARHSLAARGAGLEVPGTFAPVGGDALLHETAGFAKVLCTSAFYTGVDWRRAAAVSGYVVSPLASRAQVRDTVIDRVRREVRLTLKDGRTRAARAFGHQGCVTLQLGEDSVHFTPVNVRPRLPDAERTPWPMGDRIPDAPWPAGADSAGVARALAAFAGPPEAMTLAVVITHRGRLLGEWYAPGIGIHTPLQGWSMGKSVAGTLVARLIELGVYRLDQPAPIPEWEAPGDPRQRIRIVDLMRMSSGLRLRAPADPDYDPSLGYPEHLFTYTGPLDMYHFAATRPVQWPPNTVGRYRNADPLLAGYLVKLGAAQLGMDPHEFPQRALFDSIGVRDAILETDVFGNFLLQGYVLMPARDWARLGNLYLQDGVWNGTRLLPEGYVDHVRTVAPAWRADGRPEYGGGFFWVNGAGKPPLPKDAFWMSGSGGQTTMILPSHDLVVVRMGLAAGAEAAGKASETGFRLLLGAVPAKR